MNDIIATSTCVSSTKSILWFTPPIGGPGLPPSSLTHSEIENVINAGSDSNSPSETLYNSLSSQGGSESFSKSYTYWNSYPLPVDWACTYPP